VSPLQCGTVQSTFGMNNVNETDTSVRLQIAIVFYFRCPSSASRQTAVWNMLWNNLNRATIQRRSRALTYFLLPSNKLPPTIATPPTGPNGKTSGGKRHLLRGCRRHGPGLAQWIFENNVKLPRTRDTISNSRIWRHKRTGTASQICPYNRK